MKTNQKRQIAKIGWTDWDSVKGLFKYFRAIDTLQPYDVLHIPRIYKKKWSSHHKKFRLTIEEL